MNAPFHAPDQGRGQHLIAADRGFSSGRLAARLLVHAPSRLFHRLLDRLDSAFDHGMIEGHLPDGTIRIIGGRGPGPQADVRLHSWAALVRLVLNGSVGWFKSWMAGEWESEDPVALIAAFSANRHGLAALGRARGPMRWLNHLRHMVRRNSRSGSLRNIHAHYDLGNDFYAAWLDRGMVYSSAIFEPARPDETLEDAQMRKIDAALDRLGLSEGQHLLEIGSGWGALGARAIARFGVAYTGLTLSEEQAAWANPLVAPNGTVILRDYRDESGVYDAIASVEMVEAVGQSYWPDYLQAVAQRLKPGGRAAIQYIAIDDDLFEAYAGNADFIQTYIFPGGCLLSASRFRALAEEAGLQWQDQTDFPLDYAETLKRWRLSYDAAVAAGKLSGFPMDFHRLWRFYLMYCEAGFRGGSISVAQVTLVKSAKQQN
jgi:cyclopropane-fatty-acyl-phospholipid synthase